jgi:hypothetical protein
MPGDELPDGWNNRQAVAVPEPQSEASTRSR